MTTRFQRLFSFFVFTGTPSAVAFDIFMISTPEKFIAIMVLSMTTLLLAQSLFNLMTMLFSWNDPTTLHHRKTPKDLATPQYSFTALVPVRNETRVIGHTIRSIYNMRYPDHLKEIIIICRSDDKKTIEAALAGTKGLNIHRIKILVSEIDLPNKPSGLNLGLQYATGDIIVVFDAEDEPHRDIYTIVNSVYVKDEVDVVQAGVQLMNYRSSWYAPLNCLEYFFWFKSCLHAFSQQGAMPLGGNTVFIKKEWLHKVGGWNPHRLTEDADLGIRLSVAGAKMKVVYDERHVTREETPPTLHAFIKQRTRWNQGFLEIFFSFEWMKLPGLWKKFLIAYLLFIPQIQVLWIIYLPVTFFILRNYQNSVVIALISFLPAYILIIQLVAYILGMLEFSRDYNLKMPWWYPAKLVLTFFPYQIVLAISSLRAIFRYVLAINGWEKTAHFNLHRETVASPAPLTSL